MKTRRSIMWRSVFGAALLTVCASGSLRADTYRSDVELSNREIALRQVPLGDLVADAVRASARADVGLVPASAFSDTSVTLARGGFALGDALKSLEYKSETIAVVKLTGEQIRAALENSLYQYPARSNALLQTSGLVVSFSASASPGRRVTSAKINGADVQSGKIYRVAMPISLANGGNAYFKYWKKSDTEKDTGVTLEAALTAYLNDHKIIAKGEDRLVASSK